MNHPERLEQFKICCFLDEEYPDVLYTSSIAGLRLPSHLMANLKASGYKNGTPDILIFESKKNYHALFLEVKTKEGKASKSQLEFQEWSIRKGYKYEFCYGREHGIKIIKDYLE